MRFNLRESLTLPLSPEQRIFFANSDVRDADGALAVCYRTAASIVGRKSFVGVIKWFTTNESYAKRYGVGENKETYECYLNCNKILDCGSTDGLLFGLNPVTKPFSNHFIEILDTLGVSEDEVRELFKDEFSNPQSQTWHIFTIVRTEKFGELVKDKGFDCIKTIEEKINTCYGALYDEDIKLVINTDPQVSDDINR